jgi:homoserine O-acetyltransferase
MSTVARQIERQVQRVPYFELECGTVLRDVEQHYTLDGELNQAGDNLVVIFHSLTGEPTPREWWPGVVGPGAIIDPERYAVLCPNLLGSCYGTTWQGVEPAGTGTAGVGTAHAHDSAVRPPITTRDMARLIATLVEELGAGSVALATGGSLGGMVALEWAATFPALSRAVVSFAAPAAHTAQAIAWNQVQRTALELGESAANAEAGLALARMVAMISYRTAIEFDARFGRERRDDGRFQMQSYLDHHGEKLVRRFDPASYRTLVDAMDAHDLARGRDDVASALRAFRGHLVGVGIPGDLLYAEDDVRRWTDAASATYRAIHSPHGHDAFLLETAQVAAIVAEALAVEGGAP